MRKRPRIVIADQHPLMLVGLREFLREYFEVVAAVTDGNDLVNTCTRLEPDGLIIDSALAKYDAFRAVQAIKTMLPRTHLIFFARDTSPMALREAFQHGASGYVLKTDPADQLRTAMDTVLAGKAYAPSCVGRGPEVTAASGLWGRSPRIARELTERHRQVINLIADGKPSKQIAHDLGISVKTVEYHRQRIMNRLGVRSVAELVMRGIERGDIRRVWV